MEMDEEFLEVNDLDWFASSQDGVLAHFATEGRGYIPVQIRKSIAAYEKNLDYFSALEGGVEGLVVEENLPKFNSALQRERYLISFICMARRGLYSYDVNQWGGYSLIARPQVGLRMCDLPEDIRSVVHVLSLSFYSRIDISGLI
ncbi:hypothetical protein [Pseudomonas entomophila]|uniref:hypothetical protein n=1 Tax=Pseudomonas entomophila TaxID=312306 RepID=UPI001F00E16F|nr:hypothetical protein [Pseudomonas entomophila]MCG8296572.1 hypothetical protein [Pseudomonas entomophila]